MATKKKPKASATSLADRIHAVNVALREGEPDNITTDPVFGYTGYKPQPIIDAMNKHIGLGQWGFEVVNMEVVREDKEGHPTMVMCLIKVSMKGVEWMPSAYGQGMITRQAVGDGYKSAQTDALKKALSYFSIGSRAYHGMLKDNTPAGRRQRQQGHIAASYAKKAPPTPTK